MSDAKVHRRFFGSATEFFDSVAPSVTLGREVADRFTNAASMFETTANGDEFHGKSENVDAKFRKHRFESEASLLSDTMGELKSAAFDVDRWQFVRMLEEGDEVDCDRWLAGSDRCWSGVRRRRLEKRVVRIFTALGGSCARSRKELSVCGAVAVSLVEMLEAAGVAVELWGCGAFRDVFRNGDDGLACVRLKGSDGFSDLGLVNFVCGDSHVFRNSFFRAMSLLGTEIGSDVCCNMGYAVSLTADILGLEDCEMEDTVVVPAMFDREVASKWLDDFVNNRKEARQ